MNEKELMEKPLVILKTKEGKQIILFFEKGSYTEEGKKIVFEGVLNEKLLLWGVV